MTLAAAREKTGLTESTTIWYRCPIPIPGGKEYDLGKPINDMASRTEITLGSLGGFPLQDEGWRV